MEVDRIIHNITKRLSGVQGISAIVLGGSRARGTHSEESDIDIGIYYESNDSIDIKALQVVAKDVDEMNRSDLLTNIGKWGPWINGGGWLKVNGYPVDFLYRDVNKVASVMDDCLSGKISIDYYPGHPHGFINSIYMAEIALCKILWDPSKVITDLKKRTREFNNVLQKAIVEKFLWEASFSLSNATKGILRNDVYYIAGCCFRTVSCLNQVIFALNQQYCMNEKGAVHVADSFDKTPGEYKKRIDDIFGLLSQNQAACKEALKHLEEIVHEVELLNSNKPL